MGPAVGVLSEYAHWLSGCCEVCAAAGKCGRLALCGVCEEEDEWGRVEREEEEKKKERRKEKNRCQ
jgi:hypothetical protein